MCYFRWSNIANEPWSKINHSDLMLCFQLKKCAPESDTILKFQMHFPETRRELEYIYYVIAQQANTINSNILKYLETNTLIHYRQYSFYHERFSADLHASINYSWSKSLEFHGESQVIALDISMAFDMVWLTFLLHNVLLFQNTYLNFHLLLLFTSMLVYHSDKLYNLLYFVWTLTTFFIPFKLPSNQQRHLPT